MGRAALIIALLTQLRVGCDCSGAPAWMPPDSGARDAGDDGGELDSGMPGSDAGRVLLHSLGAADQHGCRIVGGRLSCYGRANTGALGVGDTLLRAVPVPVMSTASFVSVEAAGFMTSAATCAVDSSSDLWCWGGDSDGQLGQGTQGTPLSSPTRVPLPVKVRRLGETHFSSFCLIGTDGSLWCWGRNAEGQLTEGDGGLPNSVTRPEHIATFTDWVDVSSGQGHTCAVRANGELWCWGRNANSELGLGVGLPPQVPEPQRVGTGFSQVAAGQSHTYAIAAGRLWCWGAQAVVLAGANRTQPYALDAGDTWRAITTNTFHACAIDGLGELYCWGRNVEGQLCLGDTMDRSLPARVPFGGDWVAVSANRFSTCAQKADGGTFCCGDNSDLTLGVGMTPSRTPTMLQQPP